VNSAEAKKILIACRPGTDDLRTPEAVEALELARRDAELLRWWEQQRAWHDGVRESFATIPIPARLQERILARAKIIELPWWQQRIVWRAAAALVLLAALAVLLWPSRREDTFQTFRSRMVRNVERTYSMDIVTNDMTQIRAYLATKQAPADYVLPAGLDKLPALGGGALGWQDRRAAMVCLDSQTKRTLFLFIVDRTSVRGAPDRPEFAAVKRLMTVSWSSGGKTYVLAGSGSQDWLRSFL
jgi:hypothetical protein